MGYLLDSKASLGYQLGVFSFFFFLLPFLVWLGGLYTYLSRICFSCYFIVWHIDVGVTGILMLVSLDSALV